PVRSSACTRASRSPSAATTARAGRPCPTGSRSTGCPSARCARPRTRSPSRSGSPSSTSWPTTTASTTSACTSSDGPDGGRRQGYHPVVPFPRKLLNDTEEVVLDLHPHWSFLAKQTLALLAAIVLGALVLLNVDNGIVQLLAGVLILAALGWWIVRYLD